MPAEKGTKQITSKQMVLKILRNKPHRTQNYRLSNARSLTLTDDTQPTKYPTDHATPPLNKRTNNKKPTNRKHPACQTPIITPCQNSWITTLAKTCSAGGPKNEGQKRCRVRGRHSRPPQYTRRIRQAGQSPSCSQPSTWDPITRDTSYGLSAEKRQKPT